MRCSTTPASSSPQRVPIGNPSSAVNPIVVAIETRFRIAQAEQPLPRCATTTRPSAISGARPGDVFVGEAVKAVAPDALLVKGVGQRKGLFDLRCSAMKSRVEARHLWQFRIKGHNHLDGCQIVWLV